MKWKRSLAVMLTVCMIVTLMPISPASAASYTVAYSRENPEVAILNALNGNNDSFYKQLLTANRDEDGIAFTNKSKYGDKYAYLNYNSVVNFETDYGNMLRYESFASGDETYNFNGYDKNSVLYKVGVPYKNLEANMSLTFKNNWHKHSGGFLDLGEQKVLAYTGAIFYANGTFAGGGYGSADTKSDSFRIGNNKFYSIQSMSNDYMKVKLTASKTAYDGGKQVCTCSSYVTNLFIGFRDVRAPQITAVGGSIKTQKYFKAGDEITIEITFDEPIRFANDSAIQEKELGASLELEHASEGDYPFAKLTKLDKNKMYFSYTVPDGVQINDKITGISLKPLQGTGIKLVQVIEDKNFSISAPNGTDSNGFSTTTNYITDLAGNPLSITSCNAEAYIDTVDPKPAKLEVSAFTNNSDIKEALGKTDTGAEDYRDNSDSYLGISDNIHFTVYMDEVVEMDRNRDIKPYGYTKTYKNFHAETNLKNKDTGETIVLDSIYTFKTTIDGDQYGLGASQGYVTAFYMNYLAMNENIECKDSDSRIRITKLYFTDDAGNVIKVKDLCGNEVGGSFDASAMNTAAYYVDVDLPEVTTTAPESTNPKYTGLEEKYYVPTPETTAMGEGFRIAFNINDKSGVNGIKGTLSWNNDSNAANHKFKFAVTGSADEPKADEWQDAVMGYSYDFIQIETDSSKGIQQYLHICPIEEEDLVYNLLDSHLRIAAKDYAGNKSRIYYYYNSQGRLVAPNAAKINLDWYKDGVAPEAERGAVDKTVSGSEGTLTATIKLKDTSYLDSAYYIWADKGAYDAQESQSPAEDDSSWTAVTGNIKGQSESSVTVKKVVSNNTNFSKELWIKVSDTSGNTLIKNLGEYKYQLSGMKYELTYNAGIASQASILVDQIHDDDTENGALVFMLKTPDSETDSEGYGDYYVRVMGAKGGDLTGLNSGYREVFSSSVYFAVGGKSSYNGKSTEWTRMKVQASADGTEYRFKSVDTSEAGTGTADTDKEYLRSIFTHPTYSGILNVTVVSGRQDAFKWDAADSNVPVSAGVDGVSSKAETDNLTLRISSNLSDAENAFENVSADFAEPVRLKLETALPEEPDGNGANWMPGDYTSLTTLAGLSFTVEIGADKNGWQWEDIDYDNSFIRIKKVGGSAEYKVPLARTPVQTVTVTDENFPENSESGYYRVWLEINCKAGKDYSTYGTGTGEDGKYYQIFVDTTEASANFKIDTVTYCPDSMFMDDEYYHKVDMEFGISDININEADNGDSSANVLYLPVYSLAKGQTGVSALPNKAILSADDLLGTSGTSQSRYYGSYNFKIWNVTNGVDMQESEANAYIGNGRVDIMPVDSADDAVGGDRIYLIKNKINTIAVQVVKANGKDSEIKYYNIYPVDTHIEGEAKTTTLSDGTDVVNDGELIFTPADGADMSGAHVYAAVEVDRESSSETNDEVLARYQSYQPYAVYDGSSGKAALIFELSAKTDGTYRSTLIPGDNSYNLHTVNKYGNVWMQGLSMADFGSHCQYNLGVIFGRVDKEAPQIELVSKSEENGTYEATFKIKDLSLNADDTTAEYGTRKAKDLDISLYIDDAHAAAIGVTAGARANIHIPAEASRKEAGSWQLKDLSPNGIYAAEWKLVQTGYWDEPYLELTVKGATGYDRNTAEADPAAKVDFDLSIEVTDIFGNAGSKTLSYTNADNVTPQAYTTGANGPVYVDTPVLERVGYNDKQLKLTFNAPVQADASWICAEPAGYGTEQRDAFPIADDGTYEIGFSDVFGNHWTQEITLTDVFGEYGIGLDFSTLELTREAVEIKAKLDDKYLDRCIMFLTTDESSRPWNPLSTEEDTENRYSSTEEKNAKISENKVIYLCRYSSSLYSRDDIITHNLQPYCDSLPIYITNIGKGAPEATLYFYFEEYGDSYTIDNLPQGETTGYVTVSYKTSRSVTPTDGTGGDITFRYEEGVTSHTHTFKYVDQLGNEGSTTVDLEALGVTLAEPAKPFADQQAPMVNVDVMAKRFGNYVAADAFSADEFTDQATINANVKSAFDNTTYVQDYNLKLRIDDYSECKILIMSAPPTGTLSFATAASDAVPNVSVSGNLVNIAKEARNDDAPDSFTVVILDNASGDSAAKKDNYTYFTVYKSDIEKWFDNTAPISTMETIAEDLYNRTVYITFEDRADDGALNPNGATVNGLDFDAVSGTGTKYDGWFKKVYTDNGNSRITFYDIVGNTSDCSVEIADIDTTKPELAVKWSPCAVVNGVTDDTAPTAGPVNTAVTAHVESTKPIAGVKAEVYDEYSKEWKSYTLQELANNGINVTYTAAQVTTRFEIDGCQVRLTVTALNGRSEQIVLSLPTEVIKTWAPSLRTSTEELYRKDADGSSYTKPYAVHVMIEANEDVYCLNDTKTDNNGNKVLYSSEMAGGIPFETVIYKNGKTQYIFVDKAGNRSVAEVEITDIDNKAPVLTVDPGDTRNLKLTSGSVDVKINSDEDCTLSWTDAGGNTRKLNASAGAEKTITFTENGVYEIEAADDAGNYSSVYVTIGNISRLLPTISFDKTTIVVRQGTDKDDPDLKAQLDGGITVWSMAAASDTLKYSYDINGVDLSIIGLQQVPYKVWDEAGNTANAVRFIRTYDKNMPTILIDDQYVENESTFMLDKGKHILTMANLKEITAGESEPYTIKLKKGMASMGQMKYFKSDIQFGADGSFTLDSAGFYTLYVVTQSRAAFIATLYVEK